MYLRYIHFAASWTFAVGSPYKPLVTLNRRTDPQPFPFGFDYIDTRSISLVGH